MAKALKNVNYYYYCTKKYIAKKVCAFYHPAVDSPASVTPSHDLVYTMLFVSVYV